MPSEKRAPSRNHKYLPGEACPNCLKGVVQVSGVSGSYVRCEGCGFAGPRRASCTRPGCRNVAVMFGTDGKIHFRLCKKHSR